MFQIYYINLLAITAVRNVSETPCSYQINFMNCYNHNEWDFNHNLHLQGIINSFITQSLLTRFMTGI